MEALDIQLNAFELACKLKGSFAPVQTEQTNRTVSVIVLDVPRPPRPGPNGEPPKDSPQVIDVSPSGSDEQKVSSPAFAEKKQRRNSEKA